MNYVFAHHKGTSRSHSEKEKQIRTIASCFFIHSHLSFGFSHFFSFSIFRRCFLVFTFVYLSFSLFVCLFICLALFFLFRLVFCSFVVCVYFQHLHFFWFFLWCYSDNQSHAPYDFFLISFWWTSVKCIHGNSRDHFVSVSRRCTIIVGSGMIAQLFNDKVICNFAEMKGYYVVKRGLSFNHIAETLSASETFVKKAVFRL